MTTQSKRPRFHNPRSVLIKKKKKIENTDYIPTVHQFWMQMDKRTTSKVHLDKLRMLSAKSFADNGHPVIIWSYQKLSTDKLPKGVKFGNAHDIIPLEYYKFIDPSLDREPKESNALNAGLRAKTIDNNRISIDDWTPLTHIKPVRQHIAHFSDLFRVVVIYKHGGWWSDSDNYCHKHLPYPDKYDENVIFATNPSKRTDTAKQMLCEKSAVFRNTCISSKWDGLDGFSNSMMYGTAKHPLYKKIIQKLRMRLEILKMRSFITPMFDTHEIIKKEGYDASIRPPCAFVGLPWWKTKQKTMNYQESTNKKYFGCLLYSYENLLKKGYVVHFYDSMFEEMINLDENAYINKLFTTITGHSSNDLKYNAEYNQFYLT